uniref:Uncharacterized protein n=1 Tax=Arundo donax TaxID=35708 RepID=A0A0A9FCG6_ARUDO
MYIFTNGKLQYVNFLVIDHSAIDFYRPVIRIRNSVTFQRISFEH